MSSFNGKSVLVLGNSCGTGTAIVCHSATDGTSVTFIYSGSPDAAKALAGETDIQITQTDNASRNAVTNRVRESGPLDVLVVNTSIILFSDVLKQDPDNVEHLFQINTHSPYCAAVEAARQVPGGGHIIIIDSVNGDRMPLVGLASHAVGKSALQGLAQGLTRDFRPWGITINVV